MKNNDGLGVFGKYLLLKKIAEGGMAEVYLSRPNSREGNGRVQVVKRILPQIARSSVFLNMFQREIQMIMAFNHPNVVQLHDFGTLGNRPYIAMEYIEGKSLREILDKVKSMRGTIPVPMALSLIAQAAAGLHYAHTFTNSVTGQELHAVHRDISPQNLIVSYDGNLKVIDFGIAKAASGVQELTQTGLIKGKVAYFAPEQIEGSQLDARTDIFALGVVAWELLAGQRLFAKAGDTEVTVMARVANCEKHTLPPSDFNSDIPVEVDRLILAMLEKTPARRFSNASHLQAAIRKIMTLLYPNYSYGDTGKLVSTLFEQEIAQERTELREMNISAQKMLDGVVDDKTVVVGANTKTTKKLKKPDRAGADMNFRMSKLERALKQKATTRHYVMLAFYIITIVALKVSERYDFTFGVNSKYSKMASTPQTVPEQVVQATAQIPKQQFQTQPRNMPVNTAYRSGQKAPVRAQTYAQNSAQLKSQQVYRRPATAVVAKKATTAIAKSQIKAAAVVKRPVADNL